VEKAAGRQAVLEKPDRREAIVEAARSRFRLFGIRKTSMHEIAADVGIAVGTLYLYFKSKDELIIGCADRFAERHRRFAEQLLASQLPAPAKLRQYIINRYRAVEETRVGSSFAAEIARAVIHLKPERFREDDHWLLQNVQAILQEGVNSGIFRIRDIERDAAIFVQAITYFLPVAGMEPYRPPTETKLVEMIDWFIDKWMEPVVVVAPAVPVRNAKRKRKTSRSG
jgi:AcrR family transcriptional regulator